ncbi:hypothetical protein GCM10009799_44510 [Nocardiopsis rhodophaea]|uniref:DUF397 domain-containing protein n=1 Tax=Nocardiopsis rhodophaea TaxID=280238 RepID=A0ABP5F0E7_9ACTN
MISPQAWKKSSYSGGDTQECVEVASCLPWGSSVRDSKHPLRERLAFSSCEWSTFIGRLKRHDFE